MFTLNYLSSENTASSAKFYTVCYIRTNVKLQDEWLSNKKYKVTSKKVSHDYKKQL